MASQIVPLDEDIRFRKLMESSYEGLSLLNKSFEITYRGPSSERIMGWSSADLQGLSMINLIHSEDLELVTKSLQDILTRPGLTISCVFRFRQKDDNFINLTKIFFANNKDDFKKKISNA